MPLRPRNQPQRTNWAEAGIHAARTGDLTSAKAYLGRAVRENKSDAALRFNLALVHERLGEIAEAMHQYSHALRIRPEFPEAARRLSMLLYRFRPTELALIEPFGLRAAMVMNGVDPQPLAETALAIAKTGPLAPLLTRAASEGYGTIAARLLQRRTAEPLKDDLLLAALANGINRDADLEPFLRALRKALLGLDAERFADKSLQAFVLALSQQVQNNEHVWHAEADELAALEALPLDRTALLSGDPEAGRRLLLHALYRRIESLLDGVTPDQAQAIRPKALRDAVLPAIAASAKEAQLAAQLRTPGVAMDQTSKKVAAQYEHAPYPRWRSLTVTAPGAVRAALARHMDRSALAFFDGPFEVLIAGCGTGRQALQSAIGYGVNARVTAIDLSVSSLAYAARKADELGVTNIRFEHRDILSLQDAGKRFQVIEALGVLHHMADPWSGWKVLADCLEPGGLIYVGLYSAASRRELATVKSLPGYPGAGCSDEAARTFRQQLLTGTAGSLRDRLVHAADFYTLSEFRDLVLHESEAQHELPQIESFLAANDLVFRGFTIDPRAEARYRERFPTDPPHGTLAHWHGLETEEPATFDGMYRFWCEKTA